MKTIHGVLSTYVQERYVHGVCTLGIHIVNRLECALQVLCTGSMFSDVVYYDGEGGQLARIV